MRELRQYVNDIRRQLWRHKVYLFFMVFFEVFVENRGELFIHILMKEVPRTTLVTLPDFQYIYELSWLKRNLT